jgi:uncharacterized SAM-binding protein YcdF (DUF218 family)
MPVMKEAVMWFSLQKIVWLLIVPPASLILLILFGFLISGKRRKLGRACIFLGLLLFYLLSLGPVADALLKPLERALPTLKHRPAAADAVVVPGGGSVERSWIGAGPVPNGETYVRLVTGVELAKTMNILLVLTGGNGEPFATALNDADVMADAAYAMGMPRNRIIVENRSRNTLENSREVRKLLKGNRIILATSAYYMKRAVAMFTKQGFKVTPAPRTISPRQGRRLPPSLSPGREISQILAWPLPNG